MLKISHCTKPCKQDFPSHCDTDVHYLMTTISTPNRCLYGNLTDTLKAVNLDQNNQTLKYVMGLKIKEKYLIFAEATLVFRVLLA